MSVPKDQWRHLMDGTKAAPREVHLENTHLRFDGDRVVITRGHLCYVCDLGGSGMTELPDGRHVHRYPCRDKML